MGEAALDCGAAALLIRAGHLAPPDLRSQARHARLKLLGEVHPLLDDDEAALEPLFGGVCCQALCLQRQERQQLLLPLGVKRCHHQHVRGLASERVPLIRILCLYHIDLGEQGKLPRRDCGGLLRAAHTLHAGRLERPPVGCLLRFQRAPCFADVGGVARPKNPALLFVLLALLSE